MYLQITKPHTQETDEVKEKTIPLTTQFLLDIINMDTLKNTESIKVVRSLLYTKYKSWCESRNIKCSDANTFYTNIIDVDKITYKKAQGIRYLVIDANVKMRLLELNKDDEGADDIEMMRDLILY